jgi:hypothetical protein
MRCVLFLTACLLFSSFFSLPPMNDSTNPDKTIRVLWTCGVATCTNLARPGTHRDYEDAGACRAQAKGRQPAVSAVRIRNIKA